MIPFKDDIKKWFQQGIEEGATHMIIFRDLSDRNFKKIFVFKGENPEEILENHDDGIRYEAAECYSLRKDIEEQRQPKFDGLARDFD